jgi:hypothetical protein
MRKHSAISLERFRAIESEMKRGAFALVDEEEALSKAKRNSGVSLISLVQRKQRTKVVADSNNEAEQLSSSYPGSHLIYKQ